MKLGQNKFEAQAKLPHESLGLDFKQRSHLHMTLHVDWVVNHKISHLEWPTVKAKGKTAKSADLNQTCMFVVLT